MLKATKTASSGPVPFDIVLLGHDERHLLCMLLTLVRGHEMLVCAPAQELPMAQRYFLP
jgi:hypothetical protein